jgi:hypothetical protein
MKFLLYGEGWTEHEALRGFLRRWLDGQINTRVGIDSVRLEGIDEFVSGVRTKIHTHSNSEKAGNAIGYIGLADVYRFPGYPDSATSVEQRCDWARKKMLRKVDHPKFRMHFAVHEVEAWLLSDPDIFPEAVKKALPGRASHEPEAVDFDEPPGKLLRRLYREKLGQEYKKRVNGPALFRVLDPKKVYAKCPYFRRMLDDMLDLARQAGI